jgi:hypothetical protein
VALANFQKTLDAAKAEHDACEERRRHVGSMGSCGDSTARLDAARRHRQTLAGTCGSQP